MKRVLIILPDAFEILEAAALIDVFGWANRYGDTPIEIVTAGVSLEITCTFGDFQLKPNCLLTEIEPDEFDAVAIPGGFEACGFFEEAYDEAVLQTLRDFDAANKPVASICVGALSLGKSGILRGRKATTYNLSGDKRITQLKNYGAEILNEPVVVDQNLITSTSPSTAIEVAFTLLTKLSSSENAARIRELMGFK